MLFHQNIILIYVLTDALVIKRCTSGYTRAAHYCISQTCFDGCSYIKINIVLTDALAILRENMVSLNL